MKQKKNWVINNNSYRILKDNLDMTWTQGDKIKKFYLLDLFNYKY